MQNDVILGNLDDVENDEYDLLPNGEYTFRAVDIDLKDNNAGTGKYFAVQFQVVGGQYNGRIVFERFNIKNPNQQAVEIGLRDLKKWINAIEGSATGQLTISRVYSLEGKQFVGKTGIQQDKTGQHDDQNVIKRYKPVPGQLAQPQLSQAQPRPTYQGAQQPQQFTQQQAQQQVNQAQQQLNQQAQQVIQQQPQQQQPQQTAQQLQQNMQQRPRQPATQKVSNSWYDRDNPVSAEEMSGGHVPQQQAPQQQSAKPWEVNQ